MPGAAPGGVLPSHAASSWQVCRTVKVALPLPISQTRMRRTLRPTHRGSARHLARHTGNASSASSKGVIMLLAQIIFCCLQLVSAL